MPPIDRFLRVKERTLPPDVLVRPRPFTGGNFSLLRSVTEGNENSFDEIN